MATEENAEIIPDQDEKTSENMPEIEKLSGESPQDAISAEIGNEIHGEDEQPAVEVSEEAVEKEGSVGENPVAESTGDDTTEPQGEQADQEVEEQPDAQEELTSQDIPEIKTEDLQTGEGDQDLGDTLESDQHPVPENEGVPEIDEEPTINVAEPMSRGSSPAQSEGDRPPDMPDPALTPPPGERYGIYEDEEPDESGIRYEYEEEDSGDDESLEPVYNRQDLVDKYHQFLEERSQLQSLNAQLQHKLAEYFKKKKTDERQQELEKNVADQEQRYLKYMANLEELQNDSRSEQENYAVQIYELKEKCQDKQEKVNESNEEFMRFKFDIAKLAVNSRSGRPIPLKDIEQYQLIERKKEMEVVQVRLENIRLKNRLKKREMQLKAKEELAEGLHLIDFEQLKIENQTYNEKIEERNEELQKLRKKITTTVQVLTHLKEKLQFVQGENVEQRNTLRDVEARVAQKRDILTRSKQARDALRIDNVKLRAKSGLLGNEPLLRDFETKKDQSDHLMSKIEQLKMQHIELTMNLTGVRHKIEQTRQEVA